MQRIRTIKPEFWSSESLCSLSAESHLLAAALLNYADDEGCFNANPALVKAACMPLRDPRQSVQAMLEQLAGIDYLELGVGPDGRKYGRIRSFADHQRINRPTSSKISGLSITWGPPCGLTEGSVINHGSLSDLSPLEGKGREGKGTGKRRASSPAAVLELHESLPVEAWQEWLEYRKAARPALPCDERTLRKHLKLLSRYSGYVQQSMIDRAIGAGWKTVFEPKPWEIEQAAKAGPASRPKRDPTPADIAEARRKAAAENAAQVERLGLAGALRQIPK